MFHQMMDAHFTGSFDGRGLKLIFFLGGHPSQVELQANQKA